MRSAEAHQAIAHLKAGRAEEALSLLGEATPEELQNPAIGLALAAARLRTGDPAGALGAFDRILACSPAEISALHGRALALHALGDRIGALAAFRRLAGQDPDAWKAWQSIADITDDEDERIGAIEEAAGILTRLCTGPEIPEALLRRCIESLVHARDFETARRLVEQRFDRFALPADAFSWLADIHYQAGHFQEAFSCKFRALELFPVHHVQRTEALPAFDPDSALQALRDLSAMLHSWGLCFFPMAGTLLGLVREGALLPHDRDVDIGVFRPEAGMPDIAERIRAHPGLILRRDARPGGRYYAIFHQGIAIDLFVHDPAGPDHLLCGVSDTPGDIEWKYTRFGLSEMRIAGSLWPVPEDPRRYLRETYGTNWQQPDKGFASAISSPALHDVDPFARAYYALARARKALLTGNRSKAASLLLQSPVPIDLAGFSGMLFPQTDT